MQRLRFFVLVLVLVLATPVVVRAAEEAPPCTPGKPVDLGLVTTWPVGQANLRGKDGGTVKLRVANRTGRVLCRIFGELTLDGKARPVSCHEPAVEAGGEGEMLCSFMLLAGERQGGLDIPSSRRPGTPAPKDPDKAKVRVKATGLELADAKAHKEWLARREAARRRALMQAAAVRAGFRHAIAVKRASSAKEVTEILDRAFARLKECFVARAKRNPNLHIELKLRLGVSRARSGDGAPENLLAIKVLSEKGPRAEMRDCLGVLDLTTLPQHLDFEAHADVTYVHLDFEAHADVTYVAPPPEKAEASP